MEISYNRFAPFPTVHFDREFTSRGTAAGFPADLRAWMPAAELARIVTTAVRRAEPPPLRPEYVQRWELLLAWSAYAYATGRSSSSEIAARLGPGLGPSHPLSFVDDTVVREFRRLNRTVLEQTLAEILRSAYASRHTCSPAPRWNTAPTTPDFLAEARSRINQCAKHDCWSLDE